MDEVLLITGRAHRVGAATARVAASQGYAVAGRTAEAEEMARPIVFLLSDDASSISGAHLNATGGGFRTE